MTLLAAVPLGGASIASAARSQPGDLDPKFWSCCFRRALNEIAAIAGFSTRPTRAALPERCALQVAAVVASARPAS